MQHQSLTAQIASKGKKSMQNFDPTFFSEIPYANVTEINYLRDLEEKKKNIDFNIFEFEKDFGDQAPVNEFDMLANTLYKKIMQNGYIQQKKAPSKKKKKTKNPFEYDYEDIWINDDEAITMKKNIYAKLENFQCLNKGVDQFYNSELYKSSLTQIQQQSKKRTNEISMDAQSLEEIKKKIKQNISITHTRMKEQIENEKPTNFTENMNQIENQHKIQTNDINPKSPQNQNQLQNNLTILQTDKNNLNLIEAAELEDKKPQSNSKTQIKDQNDQINSKKPRKKQKTIPKPKNLKVQFKKQKISKLKGQQANNQNLEEIQNQNKSEENSKKSQESQKSAEQGAEMIENDRKKSSENIVQNIEGKQEIIQQQQQLDSGNQKAEDVIQKIQNQIEE